MKMQHYFDDRTKEWVVLIDNIEYARDTDLAKARADAREKYNKERK